MSFIRKFILFLCILICTFSSGASSAVNSVDTCLKSYQKANFFVEALKLNLKWDELRYLNKKVNLSLKESDKKMLLEIEERLLTSKNLIENLEEIVLINILLHSYKMNPEELTTLILGKIFLSKDNIEILKMYKYSLDYLSQLQRNFLFGKFFKKIFPFFDRIYLDLSADKSLQKELVFKFKKILQNEVKKKVEEQVLYLNQDRVKNDKYTAPENESSTENVKVILSNSYLSLGDPRIVSKILHPQMSLSWQWPYSNISFDMQGKITSFYKMNYGSSLVYQNHNNQTQIVDKKILQTPTLTPGLTVQIYPSSFFDHSLFTYAYSKNYEGKVPKEVIESINAFDKSLSKSRVSYLNLSHEGKTIGTMRIYQVEQKPPLEFEILSRGIKLESSKQFESWMKNQVPVFEFGRFTIDPSANKEERESFFNFIDLVFYNLAKLYPSAIFTCETGKAGLYRLYKMKWGFELMEPPISTDIDQLHILSVKSETLLQKTKSSLEKIILDN